MARSFAFLSATAHEPPDKWTIRTGWLQPVLRLAFALAAALLVLVALPIVAMPVLIPHYPEIAFESDRTGNWDVFLADLRLGYVYNLSRSPTDDHSPSWSHDATRVAYYAETEISGQTMLRVTDIGGRQSSILLDRVNNSGRFAWSPLRDELAFMLGYANIALTDTSGSRPRTVAIGFSPAWSPDSQWIAYYSNPERSMNSEIYVVRTDGTGLRNLTINDAIDWSPAWSPDNRYLAFVSARDGTNEIYRMNTTCLQNDTDVQSCRDSTTRLTWNTVNDVSPSWSADGSQIIFVSEAEGRSALYAMNADGSNLHLALPANSNSQHPAWRPSQK